MCEGRLVGRSIFFPPSACQPVELEKIMATQGAGQGLARRHWEVGQWARWEHSSLIGLSPGPGPGPGPGPRFPFSLSACCDPATLPPLPVPCQVPREGRIGFPGSLQPLRRIDSGCRPAHFKVFPIGLSCKCCTVGVTVCTVGVYPHHDVCQCFDTVDYVLWMEAAAPVQHRLKRDVIGIKDIG